MICAQQLAALLITRQVIGNFKEAVLPYIVEKVKLMWIGVRIAESMNPDSLQQFAEQSADSAKKTYRAVNEDGDEAESQVETRTVGSEEIEIVHSGLNLTQAEVEAAMQKVGTLSLDLHCVQKKTTHFCFLVYLLEVSTDVSENFRQYSWGNDEFTHLKIICFFLLNILS